MKRIAFALAAILFLSGTFVFAAPKVSYVDGVYNGSAEGHGGVLTVTVTVRNKQITKIDVKTKDTPGISDAAVAEIPKSIIKGQDIEVDNVSGASETSHAIKNAVKDALKDAIEYPIAKTVDADVVVVGGGNAGLAAAVEASNNKATVVLIEKMPFLGGNSIRAGGAYNAADPERQKKQGIEDSPQKHFEQTLAGGDNKAEPELVKTLTYGALDGLHWLEGMGMKFHEKVFTVLGALWPRSHETVDPLGTGFIKTLKAAAEKNKVQFFFQTRAERLVTEKGRVTAVVAVDKDGNRIRYNAKKGVVLATGGFSANKEMRQKYDPRITPNLGTTNHPGATGDGIAMAEKVGAAFTGMEYIQMLPLGDPKTGALNGWVGFDVENFIYVNKEGKRFVSEAERRDVMTQALIKQKDQFMYVICDAHSMPTPQTKNSFNETAEELVKKGKAFSSDTIEGLAKQIGIDPAVLKDTIDRYNKGVESKKDEFGKKLMKDKIDKPPFYASGRVPTVHHTMGGVKINTKAQVIDTNGKIIPGLYAAGEVTGGIHGSNRLGGNALADTIVFGRIAGKSVVETK